MNTPPLSTENCNATANYAGSLPDDLVCIEDASYEINTKCQINVSIIIFNSFSLYFQHSEFVVIFSNEFFHQILD